MSCSVRRLLLCGWLALTSQLAAAQSWQFQKNPDPLGGGYIAMANAPGATVQPMVRCWTEAATLDVRFSLSAEAPLPISDEVEIAFDGRKSVKVNWPRNATGLALVVPSALHRELLAKLRSASEMQLTLAVADGSVRSLIIALDGSARAINQALTSCS